MLLAAKADPNIPDNEGAQALHYTAANNSRDGFGMMRQLLIAGAESNTADHQGRRPMDSALALNDSFKAQLLLMAGADPRQQSPNGQSILAQITNHKTLYPLENLAKKVAQCYALEDLLTQPITDWRLNRMSNPNFPVPYQFQA
jgi:ankyrin repeat protein